MNAKDKSRTILFLIFYLNFMAYEGYLAFELISLKRRGKLQY